MTIEHTACLGGGVIGASWAALFLASGRSVALYDPDPLIEEKVRNYIEQAWPALDQLGLTVRGKPDAISFHKNAPAAVDGAGFIQENVPERLPIKHRIFSEIEAALSASAIVASSASGLTLTQMQAGWRDPARFVLGHPFNPPHLIPLVEVVGNDRTDAAAVAATEVFYKDIGKVTIRLQKEKNGHVANRLQAALWREAVSLVMEGVASVEDVDKAIWAGPGVRWAVMGPTMLFNLGAGEGGLAAFCDHFEGTFNGWWDELGDVRLDDDVAKILAEGISSQTSEGVSDLSQKRDEMVVAMLKALNPLRAKNSGG